jgi:hypothetical protein
MGNWFAYKTKIAGIAILVYLSLGFVPKHSSTASSAAWGFYGHKRINRVAVFTLPPEMFGFYKEHIEFLTEHSVDPDKRRYAVEGEAQRHYIDLDHFCKIRAIFINKLNHLFITIHISSTVKFCRPFFIIM